MHVAPVPTWAKGYAGAGITINTSELCSALPRPVDMAGIILIRKLLLRVALLTLLSEVQRPSQYYAVRRPYVFRAICWLKAHDQLYRDVEIDDDSLYEPNPEPHQQRPQQKSEEGSPESLVIRRVFTLPNIDVQMSSRMEMPLSIRYSASVELR